MSVVHTPQNPDLAGGIGGFQQWEFWNTQLDAVIEPDGLGGYRLKTAGGGGGGGSIPVIQQILADIDPLAPFPNTVPFIRKYLFDSTGTLTSIANTRIDGSTPYVPVGTVQAFQNLSYAAESSTYSTLQLIKSAIDAINTNIQDLKQTSSVKMTLKQAPASGTINLAIGEALLYGYNPGTGGLISLGDYGLGGPNAAVAKDFEYANIISWAAGRNLNVQTLFNADALATCNAVRVWTNPQAIAINFLCISTY